VGNKLDAVIPENVIRSRCEEWNAIFGPTLSLSQQVLSEFIKAGWRLRVRTRSGGFTMDYDRGQSSRGKDLHSGSACVPMVQSRNLGNGDDLALRRGLDSSGIGCVSIE
jgi:hypothetical protein